MKANQLGKLIGTAIEAELIKQKRPGGILYDIMATFDSSGVGSDVSPSYSPKLTIENNLNKGSSRRWV